ncbi:hypothetical protein K457DRAFT_165329 [Linnemannia elongata AG-77]|uniref:Uncharacterized protein n=1 Tax=Linnemannia elongata AG-77 TaxID=1314771 RepID=A0A197KH27_9FUNG|nr:hypothetical protein K457DRAFT_165329 [Linnemannia elongata AG-77]
MGSTWTRASATRQRIPAPGTSRIWTCPSSSFKWTCWLPPCPFQFFTASTADFATPPSPRFSCLPPTAPSAPPPAATSSAAVFGTTSTTTVATPTTPAAAAAPTTALLALDERPHPTVFPMSSPLPFSLHYVFLFLVTPAHALGIFVFLVPPTP